MTTKTIETNSFINIGFVLTAILITTSAFAKDYKAPTNQPNIILFLVDDMGWQETSVPFHSEVTELNKRYHTREIGFNI